MAQVTRRLCARLGHRCTVLVCDCGSLRYDLDPLHRLFLPSSEEEWHLEPDTCGMERLDFLSAGEAVQMRRVVRTMNELWHGEAMAHEEPRSREEPLPGLPGAVYDAACEGDEAAVAAWLDGGGHVDALLPEEEGGNGGGSWVPAATADTTHWSSCC